MGIPVLRGRAFTAQDDTGAVAVAIVSRALADRLWPKEEPIGKRLYRPRNGGREAGAAHRRGRCWQCNGRRLRLAAGRSGLCAVLTDLRDAPLDRRGEPREHGGDGGRDQARAQERSIRSSPPANVATLDALVLQANALPRLRTLVLLLFAIVAVGIVALGSYGVMSQLVSTREREFAVRLVFGARPEQLGRAVVLQVARITLPGIVVGLVAMWLLSGALKSFVFGVQPTSAAVLATSGAMLLVLSVAATLPCAIRAMRVDIRRGIGGA